jgi:N-acetylneuraminic acid mutarotase
VFGGFDAWFPNVSQVSEVYDPTADAWTPLSPVPEKLTHAGQAVIDQTIYLAGGFVGDHPGGSSDGLWQYDVTTDAWNPGPGLPGARGGGALVRLGSSLHYLGGTLRYAGGEYVQDFGDHWVLDTAAPGAGWIAAAPMPNPRNHMGAVAAGGKIYAVGGQHLGNEATGTQAEVDVYDPGSDAWAPGASLPVAKGHVTANVLERHGRVLVVSGLTDGSVPLASIDEYDPVTDTWAALTPLPAPRQSPVSGIVGERLIVSGGSQTVSTWIGVLSP